MVKITREDFIKYYDSATYSARLRVPRSGPNLAVINTTRINDSVPYGQSVYAIALDLLVDRDAANLVQHEVFCRAIGQTYNFTVVDVWSGNEYWEGLQNLTIAAAVDVLCLPEEDNPLSRPLIGGVQLVEEVNSKWWGTLALTLRLRNLLEFQVGCLTVLKKPTQEISKLLSKTETEIQSPYEMVIKEISNAINQWAQTEISAVNERLSEIEDLKRYYDYGGAL
ncbi:hypothetical protein F4X88_18365 [Candidatus Poribacteria bacterium]|nr:hypothetical protein [Candidatus Poribacteria bacterium]MYA58252.1 hypothetical protein [Candidatus Poribacteria bacterium]